jgi:hypothetical protein
MSSGARVKGSDLYNEHRRLVEADQGAELPPWDRVPQWERDEWETLANEQNAKANYPGDFDE